MQPTEVEVHRKREEQFKWAFLGVVLLFIVVLISREKPVVKPWVFFSALGVIALWVSLEFMKGRRQMSLEKMHKKARKFLLANGLGRVSKHMVSEYNGHVIRHATGEFLDPGREFLGIFFAEQDTTVIFDYDANRIVGLTNKHLDTLKNEMSQEYYVAGSIKALKQKEEALITKMGSMGLVTEETAKA